MWGSRASPGVTPCFFAITRVFSSMLQMDSLALHLNTCVYENRRIFAIAIRQETNNFHIINIKTKKNETKNFTFNDDRPALSGSVGREPVERQ